MQGGLSECDLGDMLVAYSKERINLHTYHKSGYYEVRNAGSPGGYGSGCGCARWVGTNDCSSNDHSLELMRWNGVNCVIANTEVVWTPVGR